MLTVKVCMRGYASTGLLDVVGSRLDELCGRVALVCYVTLRALPFALRGGFGRLVAALGLTVLCCEACCCMVVSLCCLDELAGCCITDSGCGVMWISTSLSSSSSLDPLPVVCMGAVALMLPLRDV
jgi:hypothetical protein